MLKVPQERKRSCLDRIQFTSDISPMGTERTKPNSWCLAGRNDKAEI